MQQKSSILILYSGWNGQKKVQSSEKMDIHKICFDVNDDDSDSTVKAFFSIEQFLQIEFYPPLWMF